jgi:hypothetical protein
VALFVIPAGDRECLLWGSRHSCVAAGPNPPRLSLRSGRLWGLCYSAAHGTIPTDRRCRLVLCSKTPIYRTSPATISFPKKAPVAERQLALPPNDGVRMSKANEFQIYAGECLSWAKSADTGEKRHQFLKLAQTWLRSAITAERQQISLDDPNK